MTNADDRLEHFGRRDLLRGATSLLLAPVAAALPVAGRADTLADTRSFTVHAGWALLGAPLGDDRRAGDPDGLRLLRDAQLLIRDGVIEAIREAPFREALPHLDMSRELLLPGFISGHTHCCSARDARRRSR